jgi:hypothetical protein
MAAMFCPACAAISRVVACNPYSPNCASAAAISWLLACSPLEVVGVIFMAALKINQSID